MVKGWNLHHAARPQQTNGWVTSQPAFQPAHQSLTHPAFPAGIQERRFDVGIRHRGTGTNRVELAIPTTRFITSAGFHHTFDIEHHIIIGGQHLTLSTRLSGGFQLVDLPAAPIEAWGWVRQLTPLGVATGWGAHSETGRLPAPGDERARSRTPRRRGTLSGPPRNRE